MARRRRDNLMSYALIGGALFIGYLIGKSQTQIQGARAIHRSPAELAEIGRWNHRIAGVNVNPVPAKDYVEFLSWMYFKDPPKIIVAPEQVSAAGALAYYRPDQKTVYLGKEMITNPLDVQTVWNEVMHHVNPQSPHREQ